MPNADQTGFATVAACIRSRRTDKTYTGAPIPRADIESLLELAIWAPTHRLTQPWRFTVLDQAAIARLGTWLASPAAATVKNSPDPAKGAAKLAKLHEKLPSLGAMVLVTWQRHNDAAIDHEDCCAAAAATQNLLLAAHARGLANFWSTTPALQHPQTLAWLGVPAGEGFIGAVWLGYSVRQPPAPPRVPLADRVRWV